MDKILFTSESVTEGHPDKVCDAVSDAILDAIMEQDPMGRVVSAPDLRAGAALVIAGRAADGYTTIDGIEYIQRGYENFDGKIRSLGGCIELVEDDKDIQKFKLKIS